MGDKTLSLQVCSGNILIEQCVQATYALNSGGCGGARYELHLRPHRPLSIIQADHQIPTHRTTIVVSATTWKQHKKDKMLDIPEIYNFLPLLYSLPVIVLSVILKQ